MSPVTYIIICPLLAAVLMLFIPRDQRVTIRLLAVLATGLTMLLALKLFWQFQTGVAGYQFEEQHVWVSPLDIRFHVGVDGLNIGLLVMGAIVGFAATCVAWEIKEWHKQFYVLLLVMLGGILGAFASLDLFFLYFFHELALVPTFIMIGVWGRGERKNYATFQITIYLSVGALLSLIGLIALYLQAGARTFDLVELSRQLQNRPLSPTAQRNIFPLLLFGFGILVSLWPFHTWAPLGYASAPTPTAMLHAGILKKFGLYGLLRVALPLLPQGAAAWLNVLAWLCLGNILYCGLVAMRQKDLNFLVGNSSVAHMGFAFLGIASLNLVGVTGTAVVMVAHGFLAALTFGLTGYIYQQTGTLEFDHLGGLLRRLPFVGVALSMAMLAGCGLPGFFNFIGESLTLFGAWKSHTLIAVLAIWGALVIAAVYMLRAIRTVLHGPLLERWSQIPDASNSWRRLPFVLLLGCLVILGCFPRLLTDKITPSADVLVKLATAPSGRTAAMSERLAAAQPEPGSHFQSQISNFKSQIPPTLKREPAARTGLADGSQVENLRYSRLENLRYEIAARRQFVPSETSSQRKP